MTAILGISAYYHDSAAALLLDGEVVAAAQENEVAELGLATMGPVPHMVSIDETMLGAPGKSAAAIAPLECPAQRTGNRSRFAADVEHLGVGAVLVCNQACIAREAFRGGPTQLAAVAHMRRQHAFRRRCIKLHVHGVAGCCRCLGCLLAMREPRFGEAQ